MLAVSGDACDLQASGSAWFRWHPCRVGRWCVVIALLALTACAGGEGSGPTPGPSLGASPTQTGSLTGSASPSASTTSSPAGDHVVAAPGPLHGRLWQPDLLLVSDHPLDEALASRVSSLDRVTNVERLTVAQVAIENGVITVAAVDPSSYRRFTPLASARTLGVWTRVAEGQVALTRPVARRLADEHGTVRLGNDATAPSLQIGALAPQIPQVDAVVNDAWGRDLGMPMGNALLVSTGLASPQSVRPAIEDVVGEGISVQILGPDPDITVEQTAYLTGGSVAAAVGTFSYRILDHGRIAPDPAWVAANIRTERVPILGEVTCHRVLFPQLRAALTEVVEAGLAPAIHPGEFGGCFYPRFIAGTHQLSLHAFGIALDLNVPGNQRGTAGEIDRRVVAIFQKWGFTWGGTWHYTDPMHFELNALVRAG